MSFFMHYSVVFCSYNHIIRSKNANKLAIFGRIMLKLRLKTEKIHQIGVSDDDSQGICKSYKLEK